MNQEAFFECSNYITNSLSIIELFKNMQSAIDFQASHGIGCIHTVSGVGFTGNLDITFEKIFAKSVDTNTKAWYYKRVDKDTMQKGGNTT